jgi:uncharacterized protein DUF4397
MRLNSFVVLGLAVTALAGCNGDDVIDVNTPPLAGVRIINALTEGYALDVRAIDQVEWSPVANNLAYRAATVYYPTEAKARHFRVFPTSTVAAVTSTVLHDTTLTIAANTRITLLVTGSTVAGTVKFIVIDDDITAPAAGQIGVRIVNASTGAIDASLVDTTTSALLTPPTWASVAARGTSAYVARPTGRAAVRAATPGSTTAIATTVGPIAPAALSGALPAAGVNTAGTKFSVYYFTAITAIAASEGRPAVGAVAASLVWYVDRNPAD